MYTEVTTAIHIKHTVSKTSGMSYDEKYVPYFQTISLIMI